MNRNLLIIFGIVAILLIAGFSGLFPAQFFNLNTNTVNSEYFGVKGHGELLTRDGYIMSYMDQGLSETIRVQGRVDVSTWAHMQVTGFYYKVYGKATPWQGWDLLSEPGQTSTYLSAQNPGVRTPGSGWHWSGVFAFPEYYEFEVVGNHYKALRVEFYLICRNSLAPWEPDVARRMQRDEAYLYEGWGGLFLPKDEDGRPRSTFEIGETVNIGVETTYGGSTVGESGHTWRVVMNYPTDRGGEVYKEQNYGDNIKGQFTFTVTADMFTTTSNNRYSIRILNTLLPQGTLNINTIDILAKAPSDVTFSNAPSTVKAGNTVTMTLSASVNAETQLPVTHFEVSVYYGSYQSLIPTNPNDPRWIIPTTDVSAINNQYTLTITPTEHSYVTVLAKAYDSEGRASLRTRYWSLFCYTGSQPPDNTTDVGDGDYGGGYFDPWLPWQPGGIWEVDQSTINLLIAIVVFLVMAVIALLLPMPPPMKIIVIILGIVLAVVIWIYLNGGF